MIQSMRYVYDIEKSAKKMHRPLSDDVIRQLLHSTVNDAEMEKKYKRYETSAWMEM